MIGPETTALSSSSSVIQSLSLLNAELMTVSSTAKRLKVLCLHGFCENEYYFNKKAKGLQDGLPHIDFVFISAPHRYQNKKRSFIWWNAIDIVHDNKTNPMKCKKYEGMIDSLHYVSDVINSKGPFDGIIGFSQGGILISLMLGLMQYPSFAMNELRLDSNKWNLKESSIKFAVNISGFIPQDVTAAVLFEGIFNGKIDKIRTPLLYICGEQEVYSEKVKKLLPNYFETYRDHTHNGGHIIPSDEETVRAFESFLGESCTSAIEQRSKL